jgi:hypothetical protein
MVEKVKSRVIDIHAPNREDFGIATRINEQSGNTNGRNDNVCGHIGVTNIPGTVGATIEPPTT